MTTDPGGIPFPTTLPTPPVRKVIPEYDPATDEAIVLVEAPARMTAFEARDLAWELIAAASKAESTSFVQRWIRNRPR